MKTVDRYFRVFKIKHIREIDIREIKRRYRILSMKVHPDKGGSPGQFRFVNDAYKYLLELRIQLNKKENKKFFSSKHLFFYGNGSIYDTKISRWVKFKGKKINRKE